MGGPHAIIQVISTCHMSFCSCGETHGNPGMHLQHPAWTQIGMGHRKGHFSNGGHQMEDPKITGFLVKRDFGSCGDPPFEETLTSCGRPWHLCCFVSGGLRVGFHGRSRSAAVVETLGGIRYQQPIRVNYKHLTTILYGKWMYINDAQCAKNHSNHSWFFVDDRKLPRSNGEMGMDSLTNNSTPLYKEQFWSRKRVKWEILST
jgi:hypothetical protein